MFKTIKKVMRGLLAAVALSGLAACSSLSAMPNNGYPVTQAAAPRSVKLYQPAYEALACIRDSGALKNAKFNVGAFVDSTGKINAVAPGSTGAYLPGQASAVFITDALRQAGAQAVFVKYLGTPQNPVNGLYTVHGFFNSLDFSTPLNADLRFAGIGPTGTYGVAMLSLSIQMDMTADMSNKQVSTIERLVKYTSAGVGVGNAFNGTLITGQVSVNNQERLQFEALNGPIALGVADAIVKESPIARARCGAMIADILQQDIPVQVAGDL